MDRIDTAAIARPLQDTTNRYHTLIAEKKKELLTARQHVTRINKCLDSLKRRDVVDQILKMSFLNTSNLNLSYRCTDCLFRSVHSDLSDLPYPFEQFRENHLTRDCVFIVLETDRNNAEALDLPSRIVAYLYLTDDLNFFKGSVRTDIDYEKLPAKYTEIDDSFFEHITQEQCDAYLAYTVLSPAPSKHSFVWEDDLVNALIRCQNTCKKEYVEMYGNELGLACYKKQVRLGMTPEMVRLADRDIASRTWSVMTQSHTDEQGRLIVTWQKKNFNKQYEAYIFTDGILTQLYPNPYKNN